MTRVRHPADRCNRFPEELADYAAGAAAFLEHVQAKVDRGQDRQQAIEAVSKQHPDLLFAFLMESNPDPEAQRLLEDKRQLCRGEWKP